MHSFQLNVLGIDVSFKADVDPERINHAKAFIEEQYVKLKNFGGQLSKETLLVLLVLGVVDDLLQSQQELDDVDSKIALLLEHIKEVL